MVVGSSSLRYIVVACDALTIFFNCHHWWHMCCCAHSVSLNGHVPSHPCAVHLDLHILVCTGDLPGDLCIHAFMCGASVVFDFTGLAPRLNLNVCRAHIFNLWLARWFVRPPWSMLFVTVLTRTILNLSQCLRHPHLDPLLAPSPPHALRLVGWLYGCIWMTFIVTCCVCRVFWWSRWVHPLGVSPGCSHTVICSVWPCWSLSGGLDLVVMGCSCIHGCTHCRCGSSLIHECIHSVCLWWCWWFNESWAARWGHEAYTVKPMVFHGHFAQSCGCSYLFINFPVWCFVQLLAHSLGNFLTLPSSLGIFDYPCEFLDHLWLLLHKTSSRTSRQNNFCLKEGTHEQTLYPWTMERDPKSQTREDLSDKCQSQLLWTQENAWLYRSRMEYKVHVADYLYQSTHKRRRLWNKQKCEK